MSISVPATISRRRDNGTTVVYKKFEELGRGGFAAVYRITNLYTNEDYALKVIPKERVAKAKTLDKLKEEISIQRSLNHPNIVRSYDNFEDALNYYIVVELCQGKSVKELVKNEGRLSETETARILNDVISGLRYLHDNRIIHRDLKLENFFIGRDGRVKIGDFGLSTRLYYDDERKHTMCGTPNYLSPELVTATEKGHSYEVDIWAVGVSAFAMLTGRPPFQSIKKTLTYEYIKNCQYRFPYDIRISTIAKDFIRSILQINPALRPSAHDLARHPFITINMNSIRQKQEVKNSIPRPNTNIEPKKNQFTHQDKPYQVITNHNENNNRINNNNLYDHQKKYDTYEIPIPKTFVTRFCDQSDKAGLGYLLLDGTSGICFNDGSRIVMDPYEEFFQYYEDITKILPEVYDVKGSNFSEPKKIAYMQLYASTLKKMKTMYELPHKHYNRNLPLKHIKQWTRSKDAILFKFDDKNVQVNFDDHHKMFIFTATKKFFVVKSIKETGRPISFNDVKNMGLMKDDLRRFSVAKGMLSVINGL